MGIGKSVLSPPRKRLPVIGKQFSITHDQVQILVGFKGKKSAVHYYEGLFISFIKQGWRESSFGTGIGRKMKVPVFYIRFQVICAERSRINFLFGIKNMNGGRQGAEERIDIPPLQWLLSRCS
jgi:hypothetical protein